MSRHQFVDDPQTWTACVAAHAKDPERPRTATHGQLCAGHHAGLEQLLAELPALLTDVETSIVRTGNGLSPKVSGTKERQIPLALTPERGTEGGEPAAWAALSAAHGLMASWCLLVLEEHPSGLHSPVRPLESLGDDLRRISLFLLTHLDWCCAQPWADDFVSEMRQTRGALLRAITMTRTRKVEIGPCERPLVCLVTTREVVVCSGILTATVPVVDGGAASTIACPGCGEVHEPWHWNALGRRLRKGEDAWLTYAQLSQILRVPIGTLKRWASENEWRRIEGRPLRLHQQDAQDTYERLREAS